MSTPYNMHVRKYGQRRRPGTPRRQSGGHQFVAGQGSHTTDDDCATGWEMEQMAVMEVDGKERLIALGGRPQSRTGGASSFTMESTTAVTTVTNGT